MFIQSMTQVGDKVDDVKGLCLVCAKEAGIQPINDMLKNMNISDDEIAEMSDQFMELMNPGDLETDMENAEDNDSDFSVGGAATFPFLNGIFGNVPKANDADSADNSDESNKKDKKKKKKRKFISQFCTDLTEKARNGELDVIIGREAELYRTIQILSRRTKNNPCLIGEPGVG